jgi:cell wall-associated NlpC family hydrolase
MRFVTRMLVVLVWTAGPLFGQAYTSPYAITLTSSIAAWTTDFAARSQAVVANSSPSPAEWYTHDYGSDSYGPLNPQLFSSSSASDPTAVQDLRFDRGGPVFDVPINTAPGGVSTTAWQQQRLLQAASQLIGTHYQHLHLPTFDPSLVTGSTFNWSPVSGNTLLQTTQDLRRGDPGTATNPYKAAYNSPQPGIDCTDFSAYVYNLALGVQMHSGTSTQIKFTSGSGPATNNQPTALVLDSAGALLAPNFLLGPNYGTHDFNGAESLDGVISLLQPGDLLYMVGSSNITHVVMWLGEYGTLADGSPSPVPLVISSHDNTPAIFDTTAIHPVTGLPLDGLIQEHLPPPGVHILPFTSDTWFYQNFSVAMQVVPEPSTVALLACGLAAVFAATVQRRRRRS